MYYNETNSGRGHAVVAVNDNRIRIFDVDKKTGEYLETMAEFTRDNLKKVRAASFLTRDLLIKGIEGDAHFTVANKFNGFEQKEAVEEAFALLKRSYKTI